MTLTSAWIQLEVFIRSEVPQKDKHHISRIYEA